VKKLEKIRKALGNVQIKLWDHTGLIAFAETVEQILGKPKLFAIVHDGTFDGNSVFYCPDNKVEYKKGLTILDVKKDFLHKMVIDEGGDPLANGELTPAEVVLIGDQVTDTYQVEGAWIVDEDGLKILEKIWDAMGPGADLDANHCTKVIAHMLAIKTLGKKPS